MYNQCPESTNEKVGKEPARSIRFGSWLFKNVSVRFGSVWTIYFSGLTRFCSDALWLGPVLFGSVPRPVLAGSRIAQFGSVRPAVRFGFSFLPDKGALPAAAQQRLWGCGADGVLQSVRAQE